MMGGEIGRFKNEDYRIYNLGMILLIFRRFVRFEAMITGIALVVPNGTTSAGYVRFC